MSPPRVLIAFRTVGLLLALCSVSNAHRLDEYLQASRISLHEDRLEVQVFLTPGVNVAPIVISAIDTNHDKAISASEGRAYVQRILYNLVLRIDGTDQLFSMVDDQFPTLEEMEAGEGAIRLNLTAHVPARWSGHHRVYFENDNDSLMGAYLMNVMTPDNKDIHILAQDRDLIQRRYTLDYEVGSSVWSSIPVPSSDLWLPILFVILATAYDIYALVRYLRGRSSVRSIKVQPEAVRG